MYKGHPEDMQFIFEVSLRQLFVDKTRGNTLMPSSFLFFLPDLLLGPPLAELTRNQTIELLQKYSI